MKIIPRIKNFFCDLDDPVRDCNVYKAVGCAHVDGPLCEMATCRIQVTAFITPFYKEIHD